MMRKETRRMIDVSSSVWHVTRRMSVMTRLPAFLVLLVGLPCNLLRGCDTPPAFPFSVDVLLVHLTVLQVLVVHVSYSLKSCLLWKSLLSLDV
jgi:hypothetical protein